MSLRSTFRYSLPAIAALLLGSGGLYWATDGLNALTDEGARRYIVERSQPQIPEFILENMAAKPLTIGGAAIQGEQVIIVEFIYTSCPTICQSAGAYYARLRDQIEAAGLGSNVKLLSVSFDPENDTISNLYDYGEFHKADGNIWTVARIKSEDLNRLKDSFGIIIINDEFGGFQHNSGMHVLNKSGKLVAIHNLEDIEGVMTRLTN